MGNHLGVKMKKHEADEVNTGSAVGASGEPPATLGPMLTPTQVAKLLNISKASLCRLTERKEIPCKRLGVRIVRYSRDEIEKWMRMS